MWYKGCPPCQGCTDQCVPSPWDQGLQPSQGLMQPSTSGVLFCKFWEEGNSTRIDVTTVTYDIVPFPQLATSPGVAMHDQPR